MVWVSPTKMNLNIFPNFEAYICGWIFLSCGPLILAPCLLWLCFYCFVLIARLHFSYYCIVLAVLVLFFLVVVCLLLFFVVVVWLICSGLLFLKCR